MMAEGFPGVEVGEVDLHRSDAGTGNGVAQGHRRVRVGSGVDEHARPRGARFLNPAHELALVVRLAEGEGDAHRRGMLAQPLLDLWQRDAAVDLRLAASEEVEVRTVENVDGDHRDPVGLREVPLAGTATVS